MRVLCLGTTGYHPSPTRHTACYYLPDESLVLDAGTGMLGLTAQLCSEPRESLDILLSHAHLDHVVGMTFILDTFAVTQLQAIRVWASAKRLRLSARIFFPNTCFLSCHPASRSMRWMMRIAP